MFQFRCQSKCPYRSFCLQVSCRVFGPLIVQMPWWVPCGMVAVIQQHGGSGKWCAETSPVGRRVLMRRPWSEHRKRLGCSPPDLPLVGIELPHVIRPRSRIRFTRSRFSSSTENRAAKEYRLSGVCEPLGRLSGRHCRRRGVHGCQGSACLATCVRQEACRSHLLISSSSPRSRRCRCH